MGSITVFFFRCWDLSKGFLQSKIRMKNGEVYVFTIVQKLISQPVVSKPSVAYGEKKEETFFFSSSGRFVCASYIEGLADQQTCDGFPPPEVGKSLGSVCLCYP